MRHVNSCPYTVICVDLSDFGRDLKDRRSRQEVEFKLGEETLGAPSLRLSEFISPGIRMYRGVKKM